MANSNKKTLKDYFAELRTLAENSNRSDLVEFINGRIEQIEKKNKSASGDRKPTAKQVENAGYKQAIMDFLPVATDDFYGWTVAEINKNVPCCVKGGFSSSKTTSLVTQMFKAGLIVRNEVKGRAYFSAKAE